MQHNLLPPNVQRKLRAGETVIAESHPAATVLWAEVVGGLAGSAAPGATAAAAAPAVRHQQHQQQQLAGVGSDAPKLRSQHVSGCPLSAASSRASCERVLSPAEAVVTLNSLYTTWEELCGQRDVLGVDFSGSTFVAVSGHDDNPGHLGHMLATAEAMLGVAAAMASQHEGCSLAVRLGLHTGPITTGLVGSKAVKLVLMGGTVEVARQLASSGCPLGLHISAPVYESLGGSSGVAAAAMPWTLQALPGSSDRQHTYLCSAATAASNGSNSSGCHACCCSRHLWQ
ncbi:nucleotide cyclase [Scenedesmus sp. NREL 46B-D3]|nr:nucleotide cyclase [Scenedesmus sp. NREL 46B-D3]